MLEIGSQTPIESAGAFHFMVAKTFDKEQSRRLREKRKTLEAKFKGSKKEARMRRIIEKNERRYNIFNIEPLFFKPCVYFLKFNHNVVYIGETTNLMQRITAHINDNTKIFDSLSFEVFYGSDAERRAYEAEMINALKPVYNIQHVQDKKIKLVSANIK